MPALGFGVFQTTPDETVAAVHAALETGYRLIDTAAAYGGAQTVFPTDSFATGVEFIRRIALVTDAVGRERTSTATRGGGRSYCRNTARPEGHAV